jgi:LruC domain-containing protein
MSRNKKYTNQFLFCHYWQRGSKKCNALFTTLVCFLLLSGNASAAPFLTCPSNAFLFQGSPVVAYGVNLLTGNYYLLKDDLGVSGNINGLGFDQQDRYIYGFNGSTMGLVRIGSDFQAQPIAVSGLPNNTSFYVGDVANHYYYLYRKNFGLYRVDLSPLDQDPSAQLQAQQISSNSSIQLTDFAFHPNNNQLYGVDNRSGVLYQINPDDGTSLAIGDTGETGTFGAVYFDLNGYFYISRNQDGKVYRIDLSDVQSALDDQQISELDVSAIAFAEGPSSSQNDGARCATAPLISPDSLSDIDFGDAPQSYGTLLADNGPRHLLDQTTYLGLTAPDGDYDGYLDGDSDDVTVINETSIDDEDGVNFVTELAIGLDAVISVYASTDGIVNAWFDWNRDGDFADDNEQNIVDLALKAGFNQVVIRVPEGANSGDSWSRFRFSQQGGLSYNGGSTSGEVEDHPISISESDLTYRYYPSKDSWVTLAYEDQWPVSDDYDMNDVVLHYRTVEVIRDNQVVRIDIQGELLALGGDYHNGFAVQLENIARDNVNQQTLRLLHNNIEQQYSGSNGATTYEILESGNNNAVLMISQDLWKHVEASCFYYRSEWGCSEPQMFDFEISVPFITPIALNELPESPYDPFIFATEGLYHGELFNEHPGRGLEIHLVDKAPTEKFTSSYFGLADDDSDPSIGRYFRNSNNLPWALEIAGPWLWPSERNPLLHAYPAFKTFVESNGQEKRNWYEQSQAVEQYLF